MIPFNKCTISFSRILGTVLLSLLLLAADDIGQHLKALGVVFSLTTFWWGVVVGMMVIAISGLVFVWSKKYPPFASKCASKVANYGFDNTVLLVSLFLLVAFGFSIWVLKVGYIVLNGYKTRLLFFWIASLIGMICLKPLTPNSNYGMALFGSMLITAAIFKALIYVFQGVSSSPFSLSWSEGSRYYYGSLFFSERIYGVDLPLSTLHPSRYMLLSLPFFLPLAPIWFHRAWQVFLWISLSVGTGIVFAKRLKIRPRTLVLFFSAWVYLFLNVGPVYYHLLVCVILIYWGVDFERAGQTMIVLLLASVWAGLSRINWIPMPFFLVMTLYFLERPLHKGDRLWNYLLNPFTWGAGLVAAFAAYAVYIPLSGNLTGKFGSTFTSALLWDRLWPNPTYPIGIVLGALLVSIPLWLVSIATFRLDLRQTHPIKILGFASMILTLFLGGLVVSVKIGGGSNLHNMDGYFVLMMTLASYLFWGRLGKDQASAQARLQPIPRWITTTAILIPILLILRQGGVVSTPDSIKDRQDLKMLQASVAKVAAKGGEILFIAERQLQVFNLVPQVAFTPEYEKIELMEMAMADNQVYLTRFYKDIASQKFDLIVTDSVRTDIKAEIEAFSEEHNVWVQKVMAPLMDYYTFRPVGGRSSIFLLTPK